MRQEPAVGPGPTRIAAQRAVEQRAKPIAPIRTQERGLHHLGQRAAESPGPLCCRSSLADADIEIVLGLPARRIAERRRVLVRQVAHLAPALGRGNNCRPVRTDRASGLGRGRAGTLRSRPRHTASWLRLWRAAGRLRRRLLVRQTLIDDLDRHAGEATGGVEDQHVGKRVFVSRQNAVDEQVAGNVPKARIPRAPAQMVLVDDVQHLVRHDPHGLLGTLRLAPGGVEPHRPSVRRHGAHRGGADPFQAERDRPEERRAHEEPGTRLGDDVRQHRPLPHAKAPCMRRRMSSAWLATSSRSRGELRSWSGS